MKIFKSRGCGPAKKVTRTAWVLWWCLIASPFVLIALGLLINCLGMAVVGTVGLVILVGVVLSAGSP